jgi:hypothetical protein
MSFPWSPTMLDWWQTITPSSSNGGLFGTSALPDENWANSVSTLGELGGLLGKLSRPPYQSWPELTSGFRVAAISRDAPIKEVPVTLPNPFDFSQSTLGALQNRFLWDKLMFDPRQLSRNPFFSSDSNLTVRPNLFDSAPMNPLEGVPILPPQFR